MKLAENLKQSVLNYFPHYRTSEIISYTRYREIFFKPLV